MKKNLCGEMIAMLLPFLRIIRSSEKDQSKFIDLFDIIIYLDLYHHKII